MAAPSLFLVGVAIPWGFLGVVAVISDIGFAEEVKRYRWWIISTSLILGVLAEVFYLFWYVLYTNKKLKAQAKDLQAQNKDLTDQNDSVFRLMTRYKAEAQEDIFKRLRELAVSSILAPDWKKKGACVERFRVEPSIVGNEDIHMNDSLQRVIIFINLTAADGVLIGMRFFVQDPTDFRKYGTIVVTECYEHGSSCSIVEIDDPAFWVDVSNTLQSPNNSTIIHASPNVIVPSSPYRELNIENATQLLDWLIQLEAVDL